MHETNPHPSDLENSPWAIDVRPEDRPGVPRETAPHPVAGAHWTEPAQQAVIDEMVIRADLDHPTAVFSTALPIHGISGKIRVKAHRIPDVLVRHWLLLLLADRVETLGTMFKRTAVDDRAPNKGSTQQSRSRND